MSLLSPVRVPQAPLHLRPCSARTRAPCPLHPAERGAIPPGDPTHRPGSPRGCPVRSAPAAGAAGAQGDPWPWPGEGAGRWVPRAGRRSLRAGAARSSEDTPPWRSAGAPGRASRCRRPWGRWAGGGLGWVGAQPWKERGLRGRAEAPPQSPQAPGGGEGQGYESLPPGTADSVLIQGPPSQRHLPEGVPNNVHVPRSHLEISILHTQAHSCRSGGREEVCNANRLPGEVSVAGPQISL